MSTDTRLAFEAWAAINGFGQSLPATWAWHAWQAATTASQAELARLQAEVEGLRKALQQIAAIKNEPYGDDWEEIEAARNIAGAALAAPKVLSL